MRLRFIKMRKITNKLKELKILFESLKEQHHSKGESEFDKNRDFLERIINRIYPEKDAKELKEKLVHRKWIISGDETDEYWQKFYLTKINLSLKVINTILEESDLFGFVDFKPIKEKVETEGGIKTGLFNFKRKVTKEK